jgi:hypothetical protein
MAKIGILGYIIIGGKLFVVGVVSGLILWLPAKLLGATITTAADLGASAALMGLGITGVLFIIASFAVEGFVASWLWKWR